MRLFRAPHCDLFCTIHLFFSFVNIDFSMNCQIICQFYYLHVYCLGIVLIFFLEVYFPHNFLGVLPYFSCFRPYALLISF